VRAVQLLFAIPIVLAAASIALAEWFWLGDLALFFLPWIALTALSLLAALWILGASILASATVLFLLISIAVIGDRDATPPDWPTDGTEFTVASFNAFIGNADPALLEEQLRARSTDILVLQETFGRFEADLTARISDAYPYRARADQNGEVAVFSRVPIVSAQTLATDRGTGTGGSLVRAEIEIDGMAIVLYAIHAATPRHGIEYWRRRNDLLAVLAEAVAAEPDEAAIIVAGDLNTPPWSPFFAELLATTGLSDTSGRLLPSATRIVDREIVPVGFGSPVDHVLVSDRLAWRPLVPGPAMGSDHRLVTVDMRFR